MNIKDLQKLTSTMNILYVEDDLEVQVNTKNIFEDLFKEVKTANDGEKALELYKQNTFDIVITDVNMPKMNGIEFIHEIKKINSEQVIIIISAHNETDYFINGIQSGIFGYILKPINYEQLFDSLNRVANLINEKNKNIEYKEHMQELVDEKTNSLEKSYQEMRKMLTTDKITGLPNANILYQNLDFYPNNDLSLIIFKIDNFDFINQAYDVETCTAVIKNIGNFLQLNLPQESLLYHFSEEEFVVTFEGGERAYFEQLIMQISAFFKETPILKNQYEHNIYITLSCGIAINKSPVQILQKAKFALNELCTLKMFGHYRIYENDSNFIKELKSENHWFEKIREIIENDKLVPYFQPIVSNKTNKIIKYECLVRADDNGEIISPIKFLESAKKAGLIGNLSKVMINKCFQFFSNSNIEFSLNITNEDLLDEKFFDFIVLKQKQYNISPKQVTFEILEDIIIDKSYMKPIENLNKLKEYGFKLALDDFGSDRSNLNRLVSILDLDYIKIDGQFIRGIDKNDKNYNIVEAIVSLSQKLNIKIVAEYVTTKEEYDVIKKLGIQYSQGYYLFTPAKTI